MTWNTGDPIVGVFVFVMGAIVGSFLNVCIYRMPRGESIVSPGSHCPSCEKPVMWFDNIPLFGFMVLGGKCRHCKAGFSPRYFVVELLNALIWLALWLHYGAAPQFFAGVILFSILLAVTCTDFETGLIPDKLSFPGMAAGLLLSLIFPELQGKTEWYQGLLASFLGLLAGGGVLYLVGMIGDFIFKKETMGGGDIKLLAMIGAFVGMQKVFFVFLLSPIPAAPIALFLKLTRKAETLPYGPYLALTGACFFLAGEPIMAEILKYYGV
jgi:leader peptidase (prepilin peptidase) / N-methyltransferase